MIAPIAQIREPLCAILSNFSSMIFSWLVMNCTGADFASLLYTKDSDDNNVYICLFTCSATCAVHLELVDSLAIPQFLQGFCCFVGCRDLPAKMIVDNAKTFKSASNEIRRIGHCNMAMVG